MVLRRGFLLLALVSRSCSFRCVPLSDKSRHRWTALSGPSSRNDVSTTDGINARKLRTSAPPGFLSMTTNPPTTRRPTTTAAAAHGTARNPILSRANDGSRNRRPSATRGRSSQVSSTSLQAANAAEGTGEMPVGGGGDPEEPANEPREGTGEESPSSSLGGGKGEAEGAGGEAGGGAEKMELRDFRARLMSKGLDGWGAGDEGDRKGAGLRGAAKTSGRWAHPLVRPELGCLVIAKENMFTQQQQYFYKAVAVVIQHGDDGTVALILNRPTAFTMGDVCTGGLQPVPGLEDNVLYMGGDVSGARDDGMDVVNLMHGREDVPGMEVVKGLRLGGLKEALALVAQGKAKPEEFKFFSRYSGWGPGQLEAEVLGGAWDLAACDLESVLQSHQHPDQPGHFWEDIMARLRRTASR